MLIKDNLSKEYYQDLLKTKKALLKALPKSFKSKIRLTKKEIRLLEKITSSL